MNGFDAGLKNILTHHMERIHISNIDKTDITIIKTLLLGNNGHDGL